MPDKNEPSSLRLQMKNYFSRGEPNVLFWERWGLFNKKNASLVWTRQLFIEFTLKEKFILEKNVSQDVVF